MRYLNTFAKIYIICFILSLIIISIFISEWSIGLILFASIIIASLPAGLINMGYLAIKTKEHLYQNKSINNMPIRKLNIFPPFMWQILDLINGKPRKDSKDNNQSQ